MHKSISIYSLLALGYFVFSTLFYMEVSAQTITITSGEDQNGVQRDENFGSSVTFTVSGVTTARVGGFSSENAEF